jgi:hypothetical protein
MLSLLRRSPMGARLWISDQGPDDYRRELTRIYDALGSLFEIERNRLLVPFLFAVIATILAVVVSPPSFANSGWHATAGVGVGLFLGVFLVASVIIRLVSRGAHGRVLADLQRQAKQTRIQGIIRNLAAQDHAIRPLVRRYHLCEEKGESALRLRWPRPLPPSQSRR